MPISFHFLLGRFMLRPFYAQLAQSMHTAGTVMASSVQNGGVCTSVWSARHAKRHAAVTRDMENICHRLDSIESSIAMLSAKFDSMYVDGTNTQVPTVGDCVETSSFSQRLDRLEILLFRTSVEDFSTIDKEIAQLMPRVLPATKVLERDVQSPLLSPPGLAVACPISSEEVESSNSGASTTGTGTTGEHEMFDIFDVKCDAEVQTDYIATLTGQWQHWDPLPRIVSATAVAPPTPQCDDAVRTAAALIIQAHVRGWRGRRFANFKRVFDSDGFGVHSCWLKLVKSQTLVECVSP